MCIPNNPNVDMHIYTFPWVFNKCAEPFTNSADFNLEMSDLPGILPNWVMVTEKKNELLIYASNAYTMLHEQYYMKNIR